MRRPSVVRCRACERRSPGIGLRSTRPASTRRSTRPETLPFVDIEPLGQITLGNPSSSVSVERRSNCATERPMARSMFDMGEWPRWCIRKKRNQIRAGVTLRSFIVRHPWRGSWVFSSAYGVSGLFVVAGPCQKGVENRLSHRTSHAPPPLRSFRRGNARAGAAGLQRRIKGAEHGLSFAGHW